MRTNSLEKARFRISFYFFLKVSLSFPRKRGPLPPPRGAAAAPRVRPGGAHAGGDARGDPLHQRGDHGGGGEAPEDGVEVRRQEGEEVGGGVGGVAREEDVSCRSFFILA